MGNIDFEIDGSSLTCDADSPAGQFVQYLNDATSWSFNNGSLLIELPADSGTMVFKYVNFGSPMYVAQSSYPLTPVASS